VDWRYYPHFTHQNTVGATLYPLWICTLIKLKEVNHVQYIDYKSTEFALSQYIEGWYNRKRIHGSVGYKTPQEI